MEQTFRLAFGNCSARDLSISMKGVAKQTCEIVNRRIEHLKTLRLDQRLGFPAEQPEVESIDNQDVDIITVHEVLEDGTHLIVVQAFRPTLLCPTWISRSGIGQMVAEGIVISPDGTMSNAAHEDLIVYR